MNENTLTNKQLGLFGEALPAMNPIVVLGETKPEVLAAVASLFIQILDTERQQKKSEINHARCN